MEYSLVQLNDLPDEILLTILKKLYNIEVLYSLLDVNKRLDTIVRDSIFISHLKLIRFPNDITYRLPEPMLNRFCVEILPKIHHKIRRLDVESSSMKRILLCTNYPDLNGLGLYDLASETARDLFTDQCSFIHIFKNQILSFAIEITKSEKLDLTSIRNINKFIYTQIFTTFANLKYFKFGPPGCNILSFGMPPPTVFSPNLLELHVTVDSYEDCLYLLDGRFNQLHTFHIFICSSFVSSRTIINNKKPLPNLKCFSLTQKFMVSAYNRFIIPLLHRTSNLENLSLYVVNYSELIIDGDKLEKNIINYLTKLKKFTFSIRSILTLNKQINFPSNEDVQYTFRNFKNNQILSCVNSFPEENEFHCHIYSHPYTLTYYDNIANNFPNGLFECVHEISLYDEHPFEHEFFLQIAQSFPFMKKLTLCNRKPQRNDKHQSLIIEYSNLSKIDIVRVHDDYVEQFLLDTKMCLPNNVFLYIDYKCLERVTHNFTRDGTRNNCFKIAHLLLFNKPTFCQHLKDYFPYTQIL